MISYTRQLELSHVHGINAYSLMVAVEVEFQLSCRDLRVSGDLFETYCDFVETAYFKSEDLTIESIAKTLGALIDENAEATVDTLIQRAYDYI